MVYTCIVSVCLCWFCRIKVADYRRQNNIWALEPSVMFPGVYLGLQHTGERFTCAVSAGSATCLPPDIITSARRVSPHSHPASRSPPRSQCALAQHGDGRHRLLHGRRPDHAGQRDHRAGACRGRCGSGRGAAGEGVARWGFQERSPVLRWERSSGRAAAQVVSVDMW